MPPPDAAPMGLERIKAIELSKRVSKDESDGLLVSGGSKDLALSDSGSDDKRLRF